MRACLGLVMIVATASAEPVCKPSGDVMIEVDQYARPHAKRATAATKLFDTGAWKLDRVSPTGEVTTRTGCLSAARLDRFRADLKTVSWKLVHRTVTCRSDSPRVAIYKVAGEAVYNERACSADVVGKADQGVLDQLAVLVPIPSLDHDDRRTCEDNPLAAGCN